MAVQTQTETHQPFDEQFFEDLEEQKYKKSRTTNKPKKKKNPFKKRILQIGIAAIVALSFHGIMKESTKGLQDTTDPNYLPVSQMTVLDTEGNPVWETSGFMLDTDDSYTYFSGKEKNYTTALGLGKNASWDEFVEKYGDYKYSYLYYHYVDEDGNTISNNGDEGLTIRQFDEQNVKNGNLDMTKGEVNVTFETYYVEDQCYPDWDTYYDELEDAEDTFSSFLFGEPRNGHISYRMSFEFDSPWDNQTNGLSSVSYSIYAD